MPTPYTHRLTWLLASLAGCSTPTDDTLTDTDLDVRNLPGSELLTECVVFPDDTRNTGYADQIVAGRCYVFVTEDEPCPDVERPLDAWPRLPDPLCNAVGRVLCVTESLGRGEWDTDGSDSDSDAEPPGDVCTYTCLVAEDAVCGRPLRDDTGTAALAPLVRRDDWCDATDLAALPDDLRAALAHRWLTDAAAEHASIASFAQLSLDLLAHGAPATLITRVTAAMQDEVRHARAAYGIASALLGRPVGPGPLPVPRTATPSLAQLAADTVRDGCVNESLAAAEAATRLAGTRVPVLRRALARVVADEARHATLARDIVAWALSVGGAEVDQAVAAVWHSAVRASVLEVDEVHAPEVGLCGGVALADVRRRVRDEVWAPETHL